MKNVEAIIKILKNAKKVDIISLVVKIKNEIITLVAWECTDKDGVVHTFNLEGISVNDVDHLISYKVMYTMPKNEVKELVNIINRKMKMRKDK